MEGICDLCGMTVGPYGDQGLNLCSVCSEHIEEQMKQEQETPND